MAYDCSQICRITSHIRLCGPGGDMSSASAALLTFSNHNPMQPASSLTGQDCGLLEVVICNNHYDYCQCSCVVCSTVSLYCPTHFAYLPARCLISARLAYRPSSLLLPCPARRPFDGPKLALGKERLAFQEAPTASSVYCSAVLCCHKRHLAVAVPSATRSASLILHLHRHTHISSRQPMTAPW